MLGFFVFVCIIDRCGRLPVGGWLGYHGSCRKAKRDSNGLSRPSYETKNNFLSQSPDTPRNQKRISISIPRHYAKQKTNLDFDFRVLRKPKMNCDFAFRVSGKPKMNLDLRLRTLSEAKNELRFRFRSVREAKNELRFRILGTPEGQNESRFRFPECPKAQNELRFCFTECPKSPK